MSVSTIFGASPGSITGTSSSSPTQFTPTNSTNASGTAKASAGKENLTESDFLNLMVTQLQNQDPTNPMSDTDMATQMAQFSTLQATTDMSTNITNMSGMTQLTSAANLIGKTVTTDLVDGLGNPVGGTVTAAGVSNGKLALTVNGQQVGFSDITGISPTVPATSSSTTGN